MARNEKIIAAVDVGTTKIAVIVGRRNEDGKVEVLGFGQAKSQGVKRGIILNIAEASSAISDAIRQAEVAFGGDIDQVYVNVTGQQLKTLSYRSVKYLEQHAIVTEEDVLEMVEQAKKISLEEGQKIYHLNSELFSIDNEGGIANPVGATGEKLETNFKLHVAPAAYEQNLRTCFDRCGIQLQKAVPDPIASAEALLTEDEREMGVVLIDFGGGTTKMSIFHESVLCHTAVVPFGGNVITHDIKEGCSILLRQAEALKTQYGQAIGDAAPDNRVVTIQGLNGWEPKEISFRNLAYIIQARMEEIVDAVYYQIEQSGFLDKIGAGIVITGGTARLHNLNQLINFRTGFDVRIGIPRMKTIREMKELEDPRYSSLLGLFTFALNDAGITEPRKKRKEKKAKPAGGGFMSLLRKEVARQVTLFFEEEQDTEIR